MIDCDKKRRSRDDIAIRKVISSNAQTLGIITDLRNNRTHWKNWFIHATKPLQEKWFSVEWNGLTKAEGMYPD